jgi:hypothetical protein
MTRKEMFWFAATVTAVPALVFALFILLSYFSLGGDLESFRKQILAAYEAGDLSDNNYAYGNTNVGSHQFNDCFILDMAIDQEAPSRWKLATSPEMSDYPDAAGFEKPCLALHKFVREEVPLPAEKFYHRYMHGHTVLVRYLLPVFGLHNLRLFLSGTLSIVIMSITALSMYRLARGGDLWTHLLFLVIGLSLARWFGLEVFSQSLSHAPADFVVAAFVLFLCAAAQRGCTRAQIVLTSTLFGCFTMLTEFLTGGLPLGLALVVGTCPFVFKHKMSGKELIASTAMAGGSLCWSRGPLLGVQGCVSDSCVRSGRAGRLYPPTRHANGPGQGNGAA